MQKVHVVLFEEKMKLASSVKRRNTQIQTIPLTSIILNNSLDNDSKLANCRSMKRSKEIRNSNHQPLPGHDILRVDSFTFEWIELETKKE